MISLIWIHRLAVASQALLALGIMAWTQFSALGVIAGAVLLLPLPSIARGNTYTAGWFSMLVVIYCGFLLADAYAHPQAKLASMGLALLAAVSFVSLVLYVPLRSRQRAAEAAAAAAASPAAQKAG